MLSGDRHFLLTCGMQRSQGHQCAASSARKEKTGEILHSNVTGALPQRSFRPVGPGSGGFSCEDVPQVKGQPGCSRTPPAVAPTASAFRDIQQLCSQQENRPLPLILTVHDLPRNSKTYASPPPTPQISESPWLEPGHVPTLSEASRGTLGWPGITRGHPWSLSMLPFVHNGQSGERRRGDGHGAGRPASGLGTSASDGQPSVIPELPQLVAVRRQASYLTSLSLGVTTCNMGYSSWFRIE